MIGWYIHHHGLGHQRRFEAIRPSLYVPVQAFSSRPGNGIIRLPIDVGSPRSRACATAPDAHGFHYAPLGVDGVRDRMAIMAAWMAESRPDVFVVDVSVEVAALARLLSVPTVVMRQHGRRQDAPHVRCYRNAVALLAPFPEDLESPHTSDWVRDKTIYAGGFSRFDDRSMAGPAAGTGLGEIPGGPGPDRPADGRRRVVVLNGRGGEVEWPVAAAAAATPEWSWSVLGGRHAGSHGVGWVDDPWPWLRAADVIVTHAGHNAVMECAASRRPTVVIPQGRPFAEQHDKAAVLERTGAMLVQPNWPRPQEWASVLNRAVDLDPAGMSRIVDGGGAVRAARALGRLADDFGPDARPGPARRSIVLDRERPVLR